MAPVGVPELQLKIHGPLSWTQSSCQGLLLVMEAGESEPVLVLGSQRCPALSPEDLLLPLEEGALESAPNGAARRNFACWRDWTQEGIT